MAGFSKPPWCLADMVEEVVRLIMRLLMLNLHALRNANEDVDVLAKALGNHLLLLFL